MKHIVSFSTGLSSAITVERVLQRYGAKNTIIVFMDTTIEDDDNYRFMADCQKRWPPIVTLADGRDPYQVAFDVQIIPNQKIAPCTFRLKIELFRDWLEQFRSHQRQYPQATIHIGYDFMEAHRCGPTQNAYQQLGWMVDFPLLWKPFEVRRYVDVCRDDWGIEPPRMYALGYSHANCGGVCVKQGQGDWLRTLLNFPERYAVAEDWEHKMRQNPTRRKYAILRDQKNGEVKPLTLRKFRQRYKASRELQPELLDFTAPCVACGVGDLLAA